MVALCALWRSGLDRVADDEDSFERVRDAGDLRQRTIWPEGDGYDRQDIEQLAIHLQEDMGCPSADILNALLAAKPGVTYLATARPDFRLDPQPKHAEPVE